MENGTILGNVVFSHELYRMFWNINNLCNNEVGPKVEEVNINES